MSLPPPEQALEVGNSSHIVQLSRSICLPTHFWDSTLHPDTSCVRRVGDYNAVPMQTTIRPVRFGTSTGAETARALARTRTMVQVSAC